ncbi:OLC1v1002070C1 [Oldenlandia corymbosa var. corymbosa]|uniref:OLC1v1002070C1 n=1 Tax=Oldenlandia corymbosa var. corymbosa TaxID=529605 RepID=A0AAV1D6R9_OLDCO|nr:OLC1v1002070C1 [Oldenlandia corymbosa var. corymbosa]
MSTAAISGLPLSSRSPGTIQGLHNVRLTNVSTLWPRANMFKGLQHGKKLLRKKIYASVVIQMLLENPKTAQIRFQISSGRTDKMTGLSLKACVKLEERSTSDDSGTGGEWGKVSAVLFDMDGVLCNSEELSRRAAVDVFAELGVQTTPEDFIPFAGTGEANFLGGVASVKGVKGFDPEAGKKRFFEIYLDKYAKPSSGIGFPGAYELIQQCKSKGLKVAVASSADRIKVDANLAAAGLPLSLFDAIVSADAFENLKPAPDIFLAASSILNVPTSECLVIEDALAGVQAAKAAQMRCIAVTTTLSEDSLKPAGPALIRKDISNISLDDILSGGSGSDNAKVKGLSQSVSRSAQSSSNKIEISSFQDEGSTEQAGSILGLQGSRRDLLRYGSLGVALACLAFSVNNWKAMQYASPKAIWNQLFGVSSPPFQLSKDKSHSGRIQQFLEYISDLETRGTAADVPEFPSKLDWLNSAPLQFHRDLKGKVVLLDFWTYCCINCMHVLPDLEYLEKKYKDTPFVVVGVHSAKFDNEKDLEAIRSAVLRYKITHPVVNDGDMNLWRELGVNSWPTFVLIGPNGKVLAQLAGEGRRKDLDDLVEAALLYYGQKNILDSSPIPLKLEKDNDPRLLTSPLKFPGKLEVDVLNNRLFISDSNHNRIVVTDLDGNFIVQVGSSGEEGLQDGNFDDATFNRPQGLAYNAKKNLLYVADTENHALRVIDFVNETVQTLAGNGTKGSDYQGGKTGYDQLLNSPWDVCFNPMNEVVYIAMAGQHQIWEHNTSNGITKAFSGDGYERNLNGSSSLTTSFAQPSGISLSPDLKEAYVADSESSSIRALDLKTGGSKLLAGGDPVFADNLFRFGDNDGVGSEVLLQHPLGVSCGKDGQMYVADSYNHKIKKLDPATGRVLTLAGNGQAGFRDGAALAAQLSEPSGIVDVGDGRLFIADTNNSLIRYLDLKGQQAELHTLELKGVQPPTAKSRSLKRLRRRSGADTETIVVNGGSSNEGNLILQISVPEGYHFSKEAVSKYSVDTEPEDTASIDPLEGNLSPEGSAVIHFKRASPSSFRGRINCKVYYCKEDEVCLYQSLNFEVQFQDSNPETAQADITLPYLVKPKTIKNSLQVSVDL